MIGSSGASFVTGAMISRPEHRMRVHQHPLLAGQPLLLEQHPVRHADLADVMEQPAPLQRLQLPLRDMHLPPDVDGDLLDPLAVLARERIPLVDGTGQRPDRLSEHLAHLDESVVRHARRVQRKGKEQRRPPPAGQLEDLRHQPSEWRQGQETRAEALRVSQCHDLERLSRSEGNNHRP